MLVFSIVSSAALAFGSVSLQPDPTRVSRDAFTRCLHDFVVSSVAARKSAEAFATELAQQCQSQETAYRAAVIRAETAARISQANAEEYATMEITDARRNSRESYPDQQ